METKGNYKRNNKEEEALKAVYFDEEGDVYLWNEFYDYLDKLCDTPIAIIRSEKLKKIKKLQKNGDLHLRFCYIDSSLQYIQVRDSEGNFLLNYINDQVKDLAEFVGLI